MIRNWPYIIYCILHFFHWLYLQSLASHGSPQTRTLKVSNALSTHPSQFGLSISWHPKVQQLVSLHTMSAASDRETKSFLWLCSVLLNYTIMRPGVLPVTPIQSDRVLNGLLRHPFSRRNWNSKGPASRPR